MATGRVVRGAGEEGERDRGGREPERSWVTCQYENGSWLDAYIHAIMYALACTHDLRSDIWSRCAGGWVGQKGGRKRDTMRGEWGREVDSEGLMEGDLGGML